MSASEVVKYNLFVLVLEVHGLEVEMRSLPWPLSIGQKEYGQGYGVTSRKKLR